MAVEGAHNALDELGLVEQIRAIVPTAGNLLWAATVEVDSRAAMLDVLRGREQHFGLVAGELDHEGIVLVRGLPFERTNHCPAVVLALGKLVRGHHWREAHVAAVPAAERAEPGRAEQAAR